VIASDLLAALRPVVEALERLGVPYHVGGSQWAADLGLTALLEQALAAVDDDDGG
jgi:hypothetical protein